MKKKIGLVSVLMISVFFTHAQSFIHPGLLHSKDDLYRMKKAVATKEEPIYSGFKLFSENPVSQSNYIMKGPMAMVGRNPTIGQSVYDTDANAAHHNAIMWSITGDKAYAEKAIEIINAWSSNLKSITGRDAVLMAGLGPFKMINAAEIIRYSNAGWNEADIIKAEKHFKEVIYPVLKNYAPFANGNWDAAALKTVLSIAVFCNDRSMFEDALKYYVNGQGNGRLANYVINDAGQIQESGRDQGHTQLGIGMLAECCEIAWHQGLNLYGYDNDRLLKGFEYVAKFNLGNEVPFVETLDRTGKYHHKAIARQDRGPLRAVYEQVYNHYVNRMSVPAAYTQLAAEKLRPEGPGRPGADHPGYGTLFYSKKVGDSLINKSEVPVAPAGLVATAHRTTIGLSWIMPVGAQKYTIKRAEKAGGPYKVIVSGLSASKFEDTNVKLGQLLHYVVTASNSKGESVPSREISISVGLFGRWKQMDIGKVRNSGNTQFCDQTYYMDASGTGIDSLKDSFHYVAVPLKDKMEISLRYVPQISSQFSSFGIAVRETTMANSAQFSLSLNPGKSDQIEAPNWHVRFSERSKDGGPIRLINTVENLPESTVTYGRLTGYYWLRLKREGKLLSAFVSSDGKNWSNAGVASITFNNGFVGFFAASGMPNNTIVKFDSIDLK
ncbi:alginate lyase family protein [Mucilaginibacter terrae]|nr:alginate lyase family protein [Mucilaginibacter terrae]